MVKKKVWLLGILISVLITAALLVTIIIIGGNGETGTESSGIPFLTFFAVFILPSVISNRKEEESKY